MHRVPLVRQAEVEPSPAADGGVGRVREGGRGDGPPVDPHAGRPLLPEPAHRWNDLPQADMPVTLVIAGVTPQQRALLIDALSLIDDVAHVVVEDEVAAAAGVDILLTGDAGEASAGARAGRGMGVWIRDETNPTQVRSASARLHRGQPLELVWVADEGVLAARLAVFVRLAKAQQHNRALAHRLDAAEARSQLLFDIAYRDHLTGLDNRHALFEKAGVLLSDCTPGRKLGLFILDLDGFKAVNDRFGHHVGDQVLRAIAGRLQRIPRRDDVIARLGGDEIVIVIGDAQGRDDCAALARRMIESLGEPFRIEGEVLSVGASIGISIFPDDGADIRALLRQADMALYKAKAVESSVFCFPHETPHRLAASGDMAGETQQRPLLYRPILSADGLAFKGAQLLPGATLGSLLAEARERLAAWEAAGGRWRVSVPLDPALIVRADLPRLLLEAMRTSPPGAAGADTVADADLLEMVVPADALEQGDPAEMVAILRALGVGACLDGLSPRSGGMRRLLGAGWNRVQVAAPASEEPEPGYVAWLSLAAELLRDRHTLLCLSGIADARMLRSLLAVQPDEFTGAVLGESLDAAQLDRLRLAIGTA